jgi:hypothetical protein
VAYVFHGEMNEVENGHTLPRGPVNAYQRRTGQHS